MRKRLWQFRIPTFAAFAILLVGVWFTTLVLQNQTSLLGQAGPDKEPQNIAFSNISNNSFTVGFTTTSKTIAGISVDDGTTPAYVIFDNRDKVSGSKSAYFSHLMTVSNLTPGKEYKVKILIEGKTFPIDGTSYNVKTGPLLGKGKLNGVIKGRILLPDGNAATDTYVEVNIDKGQTLAVVSNGKGEYSIPLINARTEDLKNLLDYRNKKAKLKFVHGDSSSNTEIKTDNLLVPVITLSYAYDFTQDEESTIATGSSLLDVSEEVQTTGSVKITNPKPNASFIDTRPLFSGSAYPGSDVNITIESDPIHAKVKANSRGFWSFRPTTPLYPGSHTITISSVDGTGILRTVSTDFAVFAEGSQIAQAGPTVTPTPRATATPTPTRTPSASATPTRAATPTSTPSPTKALSPTPTAVPIFTPTPTLAIVTLTPTPTVALLPTSIPTKPPVITPVPTGSSSTIVLGAISMLLVIAGISIFFLL